MEIMDVYVFSLWFRGLLYFSWMTPSLRMIHARLSLIWYLCSGNSQKKMEKGTHCWLKTND